MAKVAILGDLHGSFDARDALLLDASGLDGVVFVGDLGGGMLGGVPGCAPAIASLRTPAWWVPGNHDGISLAQLGLEIVGGVGVALDGGMEARIGAIEAALRPAVCVAWQRWTVDGLHLIAGRPHSLGGPSLAFANWLRRAWGVGSMEESTARLVSLVDEVPPGAPVLFLAHNGPTGCGASRQDPFGRDFDPRQGDWGDPDLGAAVAHARARGCPTVVVAGHMHHRMRGGGERRTVHREEGLIVVNAAVVPRIERTGLRHHVEVRCDGDAVEVVRVQVLRGARDVRAVGGLKLGANRDR